MKEQILRPGPSVLLLSLMLGLLSGCAHKNQAAGGKIGPPQTVSIAIFVHGPFAVIVKEHEVVELMPRDEGEEHELVFPSPGVDGLPSQSADCKLKTEFELKGVESADHTGIDPAFEPLRFPVTHWKHRRDEEFFVTMKLPRPHRIEGLTAVHPIRVENSPGKIEHVPVTQVLEFTAHDIKDVKLVRTTVKTCGKNQTSSKVEDLSPAPCRDLRQKYEDYFNSTPDPAENGESERSAFREKLSRCTDDSGVFFIGVGLPISHGHFQEHALKFFNERLLRVVAGKNHRLARGRKLLPLLPGNRQVEETPMLRQIAYRGRTPRLVLVASTENCTAPPVVAVTPSATSTTSTP